MDRCQEIYNRIIEEGRAAIEAFIDDRAIEDLFLDFKQSSDGGRGKSLSNIDRKNLAKAVSGFGNSEGGVIVWGVDCSMDKDGADVARAEVFVQNPKRYASLLQRALSGCTVPPHSGVQHYPIEVEANRGFVVTLVPKSNSAPHQMLPNKQYYIRAGSDFVPTPHDVLAGMFGRRPQPHIFHHYFQGFPELSGSFLKFELGIGVHNKGPGIATDIFCLVLLGELPGENCRVEFDLVDRTNWSGNSEFKRKMSVITNNGFRLPPGASLYAIKLDISLRPPFNRNLRISGSVGAGESRRYEFLIEKDGRYVEKQYNLFVQKSAMNSFAEGEQSAIVQTIVGENLPHT